MEKRVLGWARHYPWVSRRMLESFRSRVPRARRDWEEDIDYVVRHARSYELQERCVAALIRKTEVLWHLLDCAYAAYIEPGWGPAGAPPGSPRAVRRGPPPKGGAAFLAKRHGISPSSPSAGARWTPPPPAPPPPAP